ncbi:class I SAM-dependent methyltransferase [Hyalangium gracile]|uniref:class I SAM-dependent methyltransferase n=1 Tax=Hyalangium gracile TaxID=394092 RepID=UPI001CCB2D13|nr:class I SAM-dependent methyltransferase [Hyalangium gracile]
MSMTAPHGSPSAQEVHAGQAIYTRWSLALAYDPVVLGYSNRFLWKCQTKRLLEMYDEYVSSNHLDIGVGTGYFLARCRFPSPRPRLALMDLNPNSLEYAARRTARYQPERYQRNVLEPLQLDVPKFDTIGMNYLLHCMPGALPEKAVVFDHVRPLLNPGGRVFGATLVQGDVPRSVWAQKLMDLYNRKGVFHNERDTVEDLKQALRQRFAESRVTVQGCAALFWAKA